MLISTTTTVKAFTAIATRKRTYDQVCGILDTLDTDRPIALLDFSACFLGIDLHSPQGRTGHAYAKIAGNHKDTLIERKNDGIIPAASVPIEKQKPETNEVIKEYAAARAFMTIISSPYGKELTTQKARQRSLVRQILERSSPKFLYLVCLGDAIDALTSNGLNLKRALAADIALGNPTTALQIATALSTLPDYSDVFPHKNNTNRRPPRRGKKIPITTATARPCPTFSTRKAIPPLFSARHLC